MQVFAGPLNDVCSPTDDSLGQKCGERFPGDQFADFVQKMGDETRNEQMQNGSTRIFKNKKQTSKL